jgi:hypothetical protein
MATQPETCMFCERTGRFSNEHSWPQWLREVLPGADEAFVHVVESTDTARRVWAAGGPDIVTRRVCERCNTGWMNDLEVAAQPILEPMIDAVAPVELSVDDQRTLLLWFAKTIATIDATYQGEECFPPEYSVFLYERRRVPRDLHFMLACYSGSIEEGVTYAGRRVVGTDNGLEEGDDVAFGHLRIGRLLVEFFHPSKRPTLWHMTEMPHRRYFMPLPRKPVAPIRWPRNPDDPRCFTDAGFGDLMEAVPAQRGT